jgi:hypothetical protein
MTNVHVLADESLGGIQREYVEVDRPAKVGDYVYVHRCEECPEASGKIGKCTEDDDFDDGSIDVDIPSTEYGDVTFLDADSDTFTTLDPTDIVHIDGERYRMVDRKAKVGDKVIIVNAENTYGKYRNGSVIYVEDVTVYGIYNDDVRADDDNVYGIISHGEYCVLEPVERVEPVLSTSDLIANLARRVTSLERQLADTQRNLEKFAQQTESNTHDIAFLDERTALTFNESQLTAVLRAVMVAAGGDGE